MASRDRDGLADEGLGSGAMVATARPEADGEELEEADDGAQALRLAEKEAATG